MFPLIIMSPLILCCYDSSICQTISQIWLHHHKLINCLVMPSILWESVTNDYLWRVLVRHDDCRLRKSRPESRRVIWLKRFFQHASMISDPLLVLWSRNNRPERKNELPCPWIFFHGVVLILVGVRMLPACFLKWECYCNCMTLLHYYVWAGLHSCIQEEWGRFFLLLFPKFF